MTPRPHRLRRTQVVLVAFGLAFAALAPSALAATGESDDTPATRAAIADASAAREPTGAAAGISEAASEAADRRPTALEASETPGGSVDRGAHPRDERNDDSPGLTDSAGDEDGESSVGRAPHQGTSDVLAQTRTVEKEAATTVTPADRSATRTVRQRAEAVAEKARAGVGHRAGRDRGEGPGEPTAGAGHPATTAAAASEIRPRADGASREPLRAREAPGPVRLGTRLVERLVAMPATPASAPPARRRLARAALRPSEAGLREHAAPRASGTRAPVRRLHWWDSGVAPLGAHAPSAGSSSAPGGGLSATSLMFAGAAVTIAAFCLVAAPSLLQRLRLSPALVRPVAFVSLLERPG